MLTIMYTHADRNGPPIINEYVTHKNISFLSFVLELSLNNSDDDDWKLNEYFYETVKIKAYIFHKKALSYITENQSFTWSIL